MKLYELTIHEALSLLKKKEITSRELTTAVLDRIDEVEKDVGAYITVADEEAVARAGVSDKARRDASL